MNRKPIIVIACIAPLAPAAFAQSEFEGFDGGQFTNPRIVHDFEFDLCCWNITDELEPGNHSLHLDPNTDEIDLLIDPAHEVSGVRVRVYDTEGGFAGSPTSAVIARGAGGDFVVRTATKLETWETVSISAQDPGQLTGLPIGPIESLSFQASNEIDGAFFDDIEVELAQACYADFDGDGSLDLFDFLAFTNAFNAGDGTADCEADGAFDLFDFLCFSNAFNAGC